MSILQTADGSNTYISKVFGETYHSKHGALQESRHVFMQEGIRRYLKKRVTLQRLRIFEMGLGTGLNALLASLEPIQPSIQEIRYTSIEKFPLTANEADALSYEKSVDHEDAGHHIKTIHQSAWNEWIKITNRFFFKKVKVDFWDFQTIAQQDLVFYDAFAPTAQEELWSLKACQKLFELMSGNSMLTTYCAQGQFKRNLRSAGFKVQAVPGPPGKREMTLAHKG